MSAIVTRNIGVAARQWANRVSVRTVVIPGSHQEPLKEAAKRIGYWGEEQDIDSRWEPDQGPMFTPRAFEHGLDTFKLLLMRSRAAFSASEASAARDPPRPSRYFQLSRVHFLTGLPPNAPTLAGTPSWTK